MQAKTLKFSVTQLLLVTVDFLWIGQFHFNLIEFMLAVKIVFNSILAAQ